VARQKNRTIFNPKEQLFLGAARLDRIGKFWQAQSFNTKIAYSTRLDLTL